jgi:hypothetical protein
MKKRLILTLLILLVIISGCSSYNYDNEDGDSYSQEEDYQPFFRPYYSWRSGQFKYGNPTWDFISPSEDSFGSGFNLSGGYNGE